MQAAVLALSAGPVASSDGIGLANASLVLRSCRRDGRLLQPSEPAKLIDRAFRARANAAAAVATAVAAAGSNDAAVVVATTGDSPVGPDMGEVWTALSAVAGRSIFYVFAANLTVGHGRGRDLHSLKWSQFFFFSSLRVSCEENSSPSFSFSPWHEL